MRLLIILFLVTFFVTCSSLLPFKKVKKPNVCKEYKELINAERSRRTFLMVIKGKPNEYNVVWFNKKGKVIKIISVPELFKVM